MGEPGEQGQPSAIAACPGLDLGQRWDDPAHLRGELYARDHLQAHAVELANAHGEPVVESTPGPLWRRFDAAKARLFAVYRSLGRRAEPRRERSPIEMALLENASVIEAQIREVTRSLPLRSRARLPRIAAGAMRGYPRVYAVCIDYLRHSDGRVDVETLVGFVQAYQGVRRLTISELWALGSMLRIGLVALASALAVLDASERDCEDADTWAERLLVN